MNQEYKDYLLSSEWAEIRIDLFNKRGKKCEKCGSLKNLHIHHLHYNNIFKEEPEDLMILCGNCHSNEHDLINKKRKVRAKKRKKKIVTNAIRATKQVNGLKRKIEAISRKYKNGRMDHGTYLVNMEASKNKIKKILKAFNNKKQ